MGDFGIGSGYDPDFSGASGDLSFDVGGGYDPGADASMEGYDPGLAEGLYSMGGGDAASDYSDYAGGLQGDDLQDTGADWALDDWAGPYSAGSGLDAGAGALAKMARGLVGPGGYLYDTGDNLGVGPPVQLRSQGGGRYGIMPVPGMPMVPRGSVRPWLSLLLKTIANNVGHAVSARAVLALVMKWGWQAASQALGVDAGSLLKLFVLKRTARYGRGRLGPHLRTIERRCRQADGYRRRVARLAGRIHAVARHAAARPFYPRRRRRRSTKR